MKPAVIEKPSTEMLFFWDKECQQKKRNTHTKKKKTVKPATLAESQQKGTQSDFF